MRPLALLLLAAMSAPLAAQPLRFGSADALDELGSGRPARDVVEVSGAVGAAYLPAAWRGAVQGRLEASAGRVSLGLGQTVHPAAGGLYDPEADELYDVARALRYLRLNATPQSRVYARLGPPEHLTLGAGALARGYRTTTAWDARTVGLEAAAERGRFVVGGFADDVRLNGVVGGQVEVETGSSVGPLVNARVGIAGLHDLGLAQFTGDSSLTGVEAWASAEWVGDETFSVSPFVSTARYLGRGGTLGAGIEAGAYNLSNAFRANVQVALYASGAGFALGHVGPFYAVSNARERIVDADSFYDDDPALTLVGTPLDSVQAGVDFVTSGRVLAFGRFEVAGHVRRHVGADRLSAFGVRLGARLPRGGAVAFELERQGFRSLLSLLGDLGEENALRLDLRVPLAEPVVLVVQSRYGYRALTPSELGPEGISERRFLIERRFEPMVGLRIRAF